MRKLRLIFLLHVNHYLALNFFPKMMDTDISIFIRLNLNVSSIMHKNLTSEDFFIVVEVVVGYVGSRTAYLLRTPSSANEVGVSSNFLDPVVSDVSL